MNYSILFDERAVEEIRKAREYYAEIEEGLDNIFFEDLTNSITQLEINPFYQIRCEHIRCLPFRKFPFMIHYTIDDSIFEIRIRAIIHTRQSTKKWPKE